jgi:hypothetical protein
MDLVTSVLFFLIAAIVDTGYVSAILNKDLLRERVLVKGFCSYHKEDLLSLIL